MWKKSNLPQTLNPGLAGMQHHLYHTCDQGIIRSHEVPEALCFVPYQGPIYVTDHIVSLIGNQ